MKLPDSASGWAGFILATAGVISLVANGAMRLWERWDGLATKSYHDENTELVVQNALEPLMGPLKNMETGAVITQIKNLLRSRCANPQRFSSDGVLEIRLSEMTARYKEITGRDYDEGTCRDGVWYNGAGLKG